MARKQKPNANELFNSILSKQSTDSENASPISEYSKGQEVGEQSESMPTVPVSDPKIEATTTSEEVPTEIKKVDEQIEEAVENEIGAEGGDVQQLESEIGEETEMPAGEEQLANKHNAFVKAPGEAGTSEAEKIEEIWDPLEG
jgi:hypothetical protein